MTTTTRTRKLVSAVGLVTVVRPDEASPARLRAMARQVVALIATGGDEEEAYNLARQVRRAELATWRNMQ